MTPPNLPPFAVLWWAKDEFRFIVCPNRGCAERTKKRLPGSGIYPLEYTPKNQKTIMEIAFNKDHGL